MGQTTFSGPVVSQNGFIDSSFTDAERDAIVDPQPGLLIYNTTSNTYEVYTGTAWDTAFGAGGGGAGSFPYVLADITTYFSLPNAFGPKATKLLFNAAGTQVLGMNPGVGFNVSTLATPYELSSVVSTISQGAGLSGAPLGAYINGDGTKVTFLTASATQVQSQTVDLTTAYDLTSFNSATLSSVHYVDVANMSENLAAAGFEISSDGTKILFTLNNLMASSGATGYLRTVDLLVPYDMTSSSGNTYSVSVDISSYISPIAGMMNASKAFGLALNSTGTVAYVSTSGQTPGGGMGAPTQAFMFEFKLGTAYDINTIQTSYYQETPWVFTSVGPSQGAFSSGDCGLTLANGKIYVGYYNYTSLNSPAYNVSSLTALSAPNITGVSPSSGASGASVTITGTGFTGTTAVTFGGASATFTVNSATQIAASVPSGSSGLIDITVTNPAGSSTEVGAFTRTAPVGTTYAQGAEYISGGIMLNGAGSGMQIILDRMLWGPTTGYYNIVSQPTSTQYTLSVNGNTAVIATLTSFSSSGPGQVAANCYVVSGDFGPFSNSAVTQITFTQAPVTFAEAVDYTPIYLSVNESGLYLSNVSTDLTNNANGDAASNKTLLITLGNIGQTFSATVTSSSAGMSGPNSAIIQFTPPYTGAGGYITSFTLS